MHHIALSPHTKIRTIDRTGMVGTTALASIETVGDHCLYYDFHGRPFAMQIEMAKEEEDRYLVTAMTGESFVMGESSKILCRQKGSGTFKRVPISEITDIVFVRYPHKKLRCESSVFDALDADDDGIMLVPDKVTDFIPLMEKAATAGLRVQRHKTEMKIYIDQNRPSCFAAKMIAGSLGENMYKTIDDLASNGIVNPCEMLDDTYFDMVATTGIIFEGNSVYNDVIMYPPKKLGKKGRFYHITVDCYLCPIETTWFCI